MSAYLLQGTYYKVALMVYPNPSTLTMASGYRWVSCVGLGGCKLLYTSEERHLGGEGV